jgi:hypothetical protein
MDPSLIASLDMLQNLFFLCHECVQGAVNDMIVHPPNRSEGNELLLLRTLEMRTIRVARHSRFKYIQNYSNSICMTLTIWLTKSTHLNA